MCGQYFFLDKQPNSLGKTNPKCVLSYIYPALGLKTTQIRLFLGLQLTIILIID